LGRADIYNEKRISMMTPELRERVFQHPLLSQFSKSGTMSGNTSGRILKARSYWLCLMIVLCLFFTASAHAGTFREAPMLSEMVKAGKLPPVEERLPTEPLVVQPVRSIGKYGGTWRRLTTNPMETLVGSRLGYEPPVRWDRTGRKVVPGLAKSWEVRDEGRTYVLNLREGLKWSDGRPFTSEDFIFCYEDKYLNKEITPVFPNWLANRAEDLKVTAPDPLTVVYQFARPNGLFLEILAFRGTDLYLPKHYMKEFHRKYADENALERKVREAGLEHWITLFARRLDLELNVDRPTMNPWKLKVGSPAMRLVVERNPYYWKVDPEGNQLPYIDRIAFTVVPNSEVLNLKAMSGAVDMQARYIDSSKFTLFIENREKGRYRVLADTAPTGSCIYVNQYSKDPEIRKLLQDRRFRIALSVAINRPELIELVYSGLAEPTNAVASPYDPYYLSKFRERHIQYDPDLANKLLDEVGLKRGRRGMRRMPNGKPFRQILHCFPSETGTSVETWQLVSEYWREVGLDFVVKQDARGLSGIQVANGDSDFYAYAMPGMHWVIDATAYVPINRGVAYAPLYGTYVMTGGKKGIRPSAEWQRILDSYQQLRRTLDEERKLELGQRILAQWVEECYVIGVVYEKGLTLVSTRLKNMPDHMIHDWRLKAPGYLNVEQFWLDEE